GVNVKVPVAAFAENAVTGVGMIAVLLEVAVTTSGWSLSLTGPVVMPVRLIVWSGASSLIVTGLGASSVGGSLIGLTVTVKARVKVFLKAAPSLTVTVMT